MKIVHLCISAVFIDNYSYQENLIPKYHRKQGHQVTVIASLSTFNKEGKGTYLEKPSVYINNDGVKVIRLAYKRPLWINKILKRYVGLYDALKDANPDIIFSHNISSVDMIILRDYMRAHPSVLLFADNHGDYINSGKNFLSKYILHPIIFRHYARIIEPFVVKCFGVTPMRCSFLKDVYKFNPNKIDFLPMGIDDDAIPVNRNEIRKAIRKELHILEDEIVIFTGGKIDKMKNTHILLDTISYMDNPIVHLIICGVLTEQMSYLEEIIKKKSVVHYLGWCNAERVINCMVASDIACFPGTHSTLWEQSVGIGLPCIFKNWDNIHHVNINGNCVFIKGDDVEELSDTISHIIEKDELCRYKKLAAEASKFFLYSVISRKAIGVKE